MNNIKILLTLALGMIFGWGLTSVYFCKQPTNQASLHENNIQPDKSTPIKQINEDHGLEEQRDTKPTFSHQPEVRFLENATIVPAANYDELLKNVDANTEELYQNLNNDFYNLFQFSSIKEYNRLLANGMPTPEELEYVYQTDIESLIDQIRAIKLTKDTPKNIRLNREKLTSLVFNRAMGELVGQIKDSHYDYQVGDIIPEVSNIGKGQVPAELEQTLIDVMALWGQARGGLATTNLARVRFEELNLFDQGEDRKYKILTHIAAAESSLFTSKVFESYEKRNDDKQLSKNIYLNIKHAISNNN